jgi:hypothetical protein
MLCGHKVRHKYAELIRNFPGPVTVAPSERRVVFRFDGGRAVLMDIARD